MVIEIATFRLASGVLESDFLALDARVQTEFVYQQRGCVRRTTARAAEGEWLALVFWESAADADAATRAAEADPVWQEFLKSVEAYDVRRFESLD